MVTNLVGTERRMNLALEVDSLDEVAGRIRSFLDMQSPQGLLEKVKMLPKLAELGSFFPKTVRSGDCQEVVRTEGFFAVRFSDSAVLAAGRRTIHHLADGDHEESGNRQAQRRLLSHAGVSTSAPPACTGRRRSMARSISAARGRRTAKGKLEVAVAIGADPATCLAGILPVPPDMDEFMFSGFLRREPVELVRCKTVDLEVPANAEIVLEGYVNLGEMRTEGPFGDHTGFYSLEGRVSRFSRHLRHASQGSALSDDDRRARRRRRTISSATRSSAFSCR